MLDVSGPIHSLFSMPVRMAMTLGEMAQMYQRGKQDRMRLHVILIRIGAAAICLMLPVCRGWIPRRICGHSMRRFCIPAWRSCRPEVYPSGAARTGHSSASARPGCARRIFRIYETPVRAGPAVRPDRFTPDSGLFKGEMCEGVSVVVTNRDSFASMRMGIEIAAALAKLYPKNFDATKIIALVGNAETIRRLKAGDAPRNRL